MKSYRKDYPRPQFVRPEWTNLNGIWDFAFDDGDRGETDHWESDFPEHLRIRVPFSYETERSGIHSEAIHPVVWYRRKIDVDAGRLEEEKLILHFEGSDYLTKVLVNGKPAGTHRGGYTRFSLDISNLVKDGENTITVRAEDRPDPQQPRGKQRWEGSSYGCWYIQTTGIWKTVWMEYVPKESITSLKMTPDLQSGRLGLEVTAGVAAPAADLALRAEVCYGEKLVNAVELPVLSERIATDIDLLSAAVDPWGIEKWSPSHPELYTITVSLYRNGTLRDRVESYFGMREIRIDHGNILLNGEPIYQRLILDQGYWEETHLTAPSEEALIEDIDKIAALGYNGLRMHQKVEDERFLYWCDVKGLLVWCEAPSAYVFTDRAVRRFTEQWMEIVRQNYNHPSIVTWTPFNESWGVPQIKTDRTQQRFTEAIYYLTKTIDRTRPVIVNDGWEHTISDILTLHDYEEDGKRFYERYGDFISKILTAEVYHSGSRSALADGFSYKGQPIIISEYGGIAFDSGASGWGYGNKVGGEEEFLRRFDAVTTAIKQLPFVCGYCYTQATDVQQEINGLMDPSRAYKVDPEKIRAINEKTVGLWKQKKKETAV